MGISFAWNRRKTIHVWFGKTNQTDQAPTQSNRRHIHSGCRRRVGAATGNRRSRLRYINETRNSITAEVLTELSILTSVKATDKTRSILSGQVAPAWASIRRRTAQ